jgi:polyphosphate glucokinase
METILGIDIGGSGIKGAPVDMETGELTEDRIKVLTPRPSPPGALKAAVNEVVSGFDWDGPIGVGFPGLVINGLVRTAPRLHSSWVGENAQVEFSNSTDLPVTVINDADAAGLAEVKFGAGKDVRGTLMVLTLGSGIGSAIIRDGVLIPNTELGHLELNGDEAEKIASADARKREDISWDEWAERVNSFLQYLEMLFSPDLFIVGGGVSRRHDMFLPKTGIIAPVVPAVLRNNAGIVGAAMAAEARY